MTIGNAIRKGLLPIQQLGPTETVEIKITVESLHWASNVSMHNGLRLMTLWSEVGSVDIATIAQKMVSFCQKLTSHEQMLIFNMNEMRLLFKMVPQKICLSSRENCATSRKIKEMSSKGRLTVLACSSANGTLKVVVEIVGN